MLSAILAIAAMTFVFGLLLAYAAHRFHVEGDPVADQIDQLLPQTQCGQCGYPGCRPYAEAIATGEAEINKCAPGGEPTVIALAELLGRDPVPLDESVADKAPSVAAYYLTSSKAYYVSRRHPLKALVADAQSMCTEWQTGERMTQHQAREADRLQSTGDDWREIKAMHMEKDNHD